MSSKMSGPASVPAGTWPVIGAMRMPPDFRYAAVLRRGRPDHGTPGALDTYDLFYRRYPPMLRRQRAKIFAPFDALAGFSQRIADKQILYTKRKILTEGEREKLDEKIRVIRGLTVNSRMARKKKIEVSITHFVPCSDPENKAYNKEGQYRTSAGIVTKVDLQKREILLQEIPGTGAAPDGNDDSFMETAIPVAEIVNIEGGLLDIERRPLQEQQPAP